MLCDARRTAVAAGSAVMVSLMMIALMVPTAYAAVPDDAVIEDMGDMWGYTVQFVFTGADAESVEYDFGDGSPISTEWNPRHTYAEIGEYVLTQTVYNSFNGGSSVTGYWRVNILGAPYVEFVQPEGAPALDRVYAYLDDDTTDAHRTIAQPADPVWEGHDFLGWYADEELTAPFDWSQKLYEPVTAYASYSDVAPVIEHTLTIVGGDGNIVDTITVEDGQAAVMPIAPDGKTIIYHTDSDRTIEFDWTAPLTSDVTIYQTVSDIETVPVDDGIVIGGTDLILIAGIIMFGIAAIASRSPGVTVVVLILIAIAALGILDVVELPELIEGFEGVRL
ncbi:MAG: hypothetical protein EOM93_05365 [Gammaproteobacteria bacterium]|nr:hypothetical protein [Gammaproteobacteria bacterium]